MHHQHQLQQGGLAQFLHMNSTFGIAQENKPKKTTETWYMLSRQYRQPIINFIHMIITQYFPSSLVQGSHVLEAMISNSSVVTTSHVMDIINLFWNSSWLFLHQSDHNMLTNKIRYRNSRLCPIVLFSSFFNLYNIFWKVLVLKLCFYWTSCKRLDKFTTMILYFYQKIVSTWSILACTTCPRKCRHWKIPIYMVL